MFAKSASKITTSLVNNGTIDNSEFEIYHFGFEMGFAIIANVLTTLAIGFIFRMPLESLLFLAVFIPLRSYVGGFHASNHLRCYWLSTLAVVAVLLAIRFVVSIYSVPMIIIVAGMCVVAMSILVPVQDDNRPLDEVEIRVFGRRARTVLCIEFIALVTTTAAGLITISSILFCTILLSGFAVFAGAIKNRIIRIEALN